MFRFLISLIEKLAQLYFEGRSHYAVFFILISFYLMWEFSCFFFPGIWPSPTYDLNVFKNTLTFPDPDSSLIKWQVITWYFFRISWISSLPHCLPPVKLLVILLLKRAQETIQGCFLLPDSGGSHCPDLGCTIIKKIRLVSNLPQLR